MVQPVPDLPVTPPPWHLTGDGWVVFYRFSDKFVERPGVLLPDNNAQWNGGIGAAAWMDYHTSGVGAYRELLLIPGRIREARKQYFSISRIYVDSMESLVSGRANWGIPKDYADFQIETLDTGEERLTASTDGTVFAEMIARPGRVNIPVNTGLFPVKLVQRWQGTTYTMPLRLRARVSWLDIVSFQGDGDHFPDMTNVRPIGAVKLTHFKVTFPVAKTVPHQTDQPA